MKSFYDFSSTGIILALTVNRLEIVHHQLIAIHYWMYASLSLRHLLRYSSASAFNFLQIVGPSRQRSLPLRRRGLQFRTRLLQRLSILLHKEPASYYFSILTLRTMSIIIKCNFRLSNMLKMFRTKTKLPKSLKPSVCLHFT